MFYFLNKRSVLQIVLLVPLLVWAMYTIFTRMTLVPVQGQSFLYRAVYPVFAANPLLLKCTAAAMLLLSIAFLQRFYTLNKFFDNQTFMPSVLLLLFVNCGHFLTRFTPVHFTILFFSFINLLMIKVEYDKSISSRIYTSGIIVALASLFDVQAVGMALFLIFALISNRFSKAKEIVIMLLGMLLVYVYLFMFFFMTDRLGEMMETFRQLHFFALIRPFLELPIIQYVQGGYLILLFFIFGISVKIYYDNKLIVLRKRFITTLLLAFTIVLMTLFSGLDFRDSILYFCIPMSLLASMLCLIKRRKFVHDFFLIALWVLLWL